MLKILEWQKKWNISDGALNDLLVLFGANYEFKTEEVLSEEAERDVLNIVKLEASKKGMRLWRNNVGAMKTPSGGYVRFGLANESSLVNHIIKSADLIGIKPITITSDMIGKKIGQFLSREVKHKYWEYPKTSKLPGKATAIAQFNWIQLVTALGGDAAFATGEGSL